MGVSIVIIYGLKLLLVDVWNVKGSMHEIMTASIISGTVIGACRVLAETYKRVSLRPPQRIEGMGYSLSKTGWLW